jgi:CheY-like chemotaxis protein
MAAPHLGKYLLLIDDDFTTRELTSHILAADGFRVAVARNGAEALERLRGPERPDLIVLDLNMPVMDGCSFCERLREGESPWWCSPACPTRRNRPPSSARRPASSSPWTTSPC